MTRGRKPKPTALRLHEGNPGKRPVNKNEPTPPPGRPHVPTYLDRLGRAEWYRQVRDLYPIGLLSKIDKHLLGAYCAAYARWVHAEDLVAEEGMRVATVMRVNKDEVTLWAEYKANPMIKVAEEAMKTMLKFAAEMGITASSRSRLSATPPESKNPERQQRAGKMFAT
jgi:P27 family predicted phage terminase small subunit